MAIPTQTEMFKIVLDCMESDVEYKRTDLFKKIAAKYQLSDDEMSERTNSGTEIYKSRISWAVSYLLRAGLLQRASRGVYGLSDKGIKHQNSSYSATEFYQRLLYLIQNENPWGVHKDNQEKNDSDDYSETVMSPAEQIDNLVSQINENLVSDILDAVLQLTPSQFEQLVVDLIVKMGYGKGRPTQVSKDGGIDGIITCDELGFDPILTQAKLYKLDNKISRPEVQKFAGALNNNSRGVYITTSSFTNDAVDFAKNYRSGVIKLIDGQELASLMIKYNLGVSVDKIYEIKRIDSDYFDEC